MLRLYDVTACVASSIPEVKKQPFAFSPLFQPGVNPSQLYY
jgi:hypothetical protein